MVLVLPVRRGRDPDVDIRLRNRVDRIWQRALAQQCRPCEFVSSVSLTKVDIVGERYRVNAVGLDDCEFGHDAGRTINIRNVYVSLWTVSPVVYASSMFWHRPRDNHNPINCRVESIGMPPKPGDTHHLGCPPRGKNFGHQMQLDRTRLHLVTALMTTRYRDVWCRLQGGRRYAHQALPRIGSTIGFGGHWG
jgi:hypothetical protein